MLESETARLNKERQDEINRITGQFEAAAKEAEDQFELDKQALLDTNATLTQTIIDLTPPPPLYLGADGEDYRIKDAGEAAFLDKLTNQEHSRTNRLVFLPTMFKYENNVVYDPGGFNDEDLFMSDTIQQLYYQGFPTTSEGMREFILNNKEFFPDFDENGLPIDAQNTLVESIKNGIMDAGFFLQQFTGGTINTQLLNAMGVLLAGGVPLGNILNAAGDIFGPDNAIELVGVLARQVNHGREFGENKEVEFKHEYDEALVKENIEFYDPNDYDDPFNPFYGMDEEEIENSTTTVVNTGTGTINQGPGGTSVTGNVNYEDVNLGDPTDYLYQILRYIEGPEVAERFKGKGMSDPEGFELISKYLDQTTLDAAIRANAIDEVALFGTDEQKGSIEIQGDAAQRIQDIAQSLRDDQALSDIELINKYGAQAAEAIRGLDPDRLEQQSLLQNLAKQRLQEALDYDPDVLPQEKLIGQAATDLLSDVKSESLIEKAVKDAALGQLDVNLTQGEALIREQALNYLENAGKLSDMEIQEIEDNIATGLRARGRLDSNYGLMQEIVGRTQAELDREDRDVALGAGLYGEFDQLYGGRLARGATLGTAGESLTSARRADNRASVALGTELVGQLYNFDNNRIQQQNAKDTMAAELQQEYDRQSAAVTGDVFGMLLGSLSASPYGTTALSTVGGDVQAPTNLSNLTSIASQDYANAQNFQSTMEGLSALQQGSRDYMSSITQGLSGYQRASDTGRSSMTPSFLNNFEGYGDLSFGEKVGVINTSLEDATKFFSKGGTLDKTVNTIKDLPGNINDFFDRLIP